MSDFNSLGLSKSLLDAIEALGFVTPTPIQLKAIPVLLKDEQDLIALAQTGTGKTATFGLPLIQLIDLESNVTQALVLAPTRELCVQITNDIKSYGSKTRQLRVTAVYGGANIKTQIDDIKRGVHIVVATPGRLIDLLGRKAVKLQNIKYVVLDEADEMLNMGFQEDLDEILSTTPKEKKTWLFSATMPDEIRRISKKYMNNPYELQVGDANRANENIEHQYVVVQPRDKYLALKRFLDFTPDIFGIIFCRTKLETQQIADDLMKDGYNADSLHGDLSQIQRDKVMGSFKNHVLQILVATDVAARGIDVDDVTHIIHLHLPDDMDFYTHRSGRTARAGKKGISMVLVSDRDVFKIKQLERKLKTTFTRKKVPTGVDVCEKQMIAFIHKVHEVTVNEKEIASFMPSIEQEFEDLSKEEILKRFASIEFNRFLDYYRNAKDLNGSSSERSERKSEGGNRSGGGDIDRMFINLGRMDELNDAELCDLIAHAANIKPKDVSHINLKGAFSFFEVSNENSKKVLEGFRGSDYRGRRIRVEVQNEQSDSEKKRSGFSKRKDFDGGGSRGGGDRKREYGGGGDRKSSYGPKKRR